MPRVELSGNALTGVDALPQVITPARQESFDTTNHDGDQPTSVTAAAFTVHFDPKDAEAGSEQVPEPQPTAVDIEHVAVNDDPRQWSSRRKAVNLAIISITAIAPVLGVNIYIPAFNQIKQQLHASNQEIALSLSVFVFVQGTGPLIWSAISEIFGRKWVYVLALAIYAAGSVAAALARSMAVLISMRIVQAFGASVAFTLGSGTIADMYDTHERGARVGLFYAVPLLGPSIGPMLGGIVVQVWSWRATFWLMVILAGLSMAMFLFFKETFRKERSLAYQSAKKRALSRSQSRLQSAQLSGVHSRDEKTPRPVMTGDHHVSHLQDLEKGTPVPQEEVNQVKTTFADINPVSPAWKVLKQKSNIVALLASGVFYQDSTFKRRSTEQWTGPGSFFGYSYGICYTCARTFAAPPYSYNALKVGSVLLSFGLGNVAGSILGGRWSDRILSRLKAANGGFRLQSTTHAMVILPLATLAYGWTCHFHVHVAAPVVSLFVAGFSLFWAYSSSLTYVVDSNPGRASSAIAMNSTFRGLIGLVVAEVSGPIQDSIGDGGLYSIWCGILYAVAAALFLLSKKGAAWRDNEEQLRLKKQVEKLEKPQLSDSK
ncbi:hypothetical protein FRC05_002936 [Tulasnella sp. 425]|nr:hypothetical protein FRC05_002936 [Tulasnella sp. 425]